MDKTQTYLIIIIGAIIAAIAIYCYFKWFKIPKINNLVMVTGGVKSGKSTFAVNLAYRKWKQNHRRWRIQKWIAKILKKETPEEPLMYSNIPLKCNYVPVSEALLTRDERFNYGSVIYLGEISLVSNSMNYKNEELNEEQLLFYKLIAHETKGGTLVIDTQAIGDTHYAIKRSVSEYLYIHHTVKIPLFPWLIQYVKEGRYSEDGSVQVNETEDTEETLKPMLVSKKAWKLFDCYTYSALTDNLKPNNKVVKNQRDLKTRCIVSFNKWKTKYFKGGKKN